MKKIILLPLLISGIVCAQDAEKSNRVQTMQNLANGMSTIQNGLMYNNKNIVIKGVDEIKSNTKDINSFDIKNEEGVSFKPKKYSETEAKAIGKLAEDILIAFKEGNKNRVLDTYRRLQNQCMTCHALIRKW